MDIFTAFSGYDSQCLALMSAGVAHRLVGWSEIDKTAIRAHNALFPAMAGRNYGDISKIDWGAVPRFDLFTYSFPCQDISQAGQRRGLKEGGGTRSGLLWECAAAVRAKRPRWLVMENVPALVQKRNLADFERWIGLLSAEGYESRWRVLNAADYGDPTDRRRVIMVSRLGGLAGWEWPQAEPCTRPVADYLEPGKPCEDRPVDFWRLAKAEAEVSAGGAPRLIRVGDFADKVRYNNTRIYHAAGLAPTLVCSTVRNVYAPGLGCRRITGRESLRIMGVSEWDIEAMKAAGISDAQMRKLAGNSIAVGMLAAVMQQIADYDHLLTTKD